VPRSLSAATRRAIYAQQTGEALLTLLTLNHPSLPAPIRVVNDGRDLVSRGATFQRCPFEIDMPEETDGVPAPVKFRIANAHREIVLAVRKLSGPAMTATMEVVPASAPDQVEMGPIEFTLRGASYTAEFVEADLVFEDILNEPYPADTFTPSTTPGLF